MTLRPTSSDPPTPPRLVILGGGFAGLTCAKALKRAPVSITLIDKRNHHVFQPLLYQVATASLSPADIAAPIRHVLARQKNCRVLLGEAVSIDTAGRVVHLEDGEIPYDALVVGVGVTHSYFGHPEWAALAPGLKTVEDAIEIRRRFLLAFEAAEREEDPKARRAKLTFVVVGGGPTGVELAGAMAEIAHRSIPADFRSIDTSTARIVLLEGEPRVLSAYPPDLSERAKHDLEQLGVEVRVNTRVTGVDKGGVMVGSERIDAANVLWAAGVEAGPLSKSLGVPLDHSGRVLVNPDLSIPGHSEVLVAGDLASLKDPISGQPVPGVAQGVLQMGRYAARIIAAAAKAGTKLDYAAAARLRPPFHYRDKGILATIGRAKAVADLRGFKFAGFFAWALWALIHVVTLIGFRNRLIVMIQWAWAYVAFERGARLITGNSELGLHTSQTTENAAAPAGAATR